MERHRSELRIRAHSAKAHELLQAVLATNLNHLSTHHEVIVEKAARLFAISTDSANLRRKMNHNVWLSIGIQLHDVLHFSQVIVAAAWNNNVTTACFLQRSDNIAAKEACATRDYD